MATKIKEMKLATTVIGSLPKPGYLKVPSWIKNGAEVKNFIEDYNKAVSNGFVGDWGEIEKATREMIDLQVNAGLTTITDGELRRDKYVNGFCRKLNGFDFINTKEMVWRNGAREGLQPKIVSKISHMDEIGFVAKEWAWSQEMSDRPVKVTVPGPMTIIDTFYNEFYKDEKELLQDLADCINMELKKLAEAGCKQVQIDEPVLVRYPEKALQYGIDYLSKCFVGLPSDVFKTVHVCCGYPVYLDQTDYMKADKDAYLQLASRLDDAGFDALSIEDAHRRNDPALFKALKKLTIVLGVIDVVKSRVESVEEIRQHISDVLKYIPKDRLIIAPDCGMIFLPISVAEQKLRNMVQAANSFN